MIYNSALVSIVRRPCEPRWRARARVWLASLRLRLTPIGRDGRQRVWLDEDAEAIRRQVARW